LAAQKKIGEATKAYATSLRFFLSEGGDWLAGDDAGEGDGEEEESKDG
jgi:hypothetical protein